MTKETFDLESQTYNPRQQTTWQENHGNLLLGFVALVFVAGGGVLIYRQNQFVPPRFPDASMIDSGVLSQSVATLGSVTGVRITVTGAGNNSGVIRIAVYGSASGFNDPSEAVASQSVEIIEGEAVWIVPSESLPETFAIAAYHDENGDGMLNRNRLNVPSERYGFSRNARGLTGPPGYEDAVINRPKDGESIDLSIR